MKVRVTPRARQRLKSVKRWWRANRPAAPTLFDDELAKAMALLAVTPRMGVIYRTKNGDVIYRLLLRKTEQHVYYYVDDKAREVVVLTVWGVRRGRGPKL